MAPGLADFVPERAREPELHPPAKGHGVVRGLRDGPGVFGNADGVRRETDQAFDAHGEPFARPPVDQRNDALAISGNLILAAPRFYDTASDDLVESSLRSYRAADGTPLSSVDLTSLGLDIAGLAIDGDRLLAVADDELHVFSLGGEHESTLPLAGVEDGAGVAVHGDEVFVADGDARAVVVFDRASLE